MHDLTGLPKKSILGICLKLGANDLSHMSGKEPDHHLKCNSVSPAGAAGNVPWLDSTAG